MAMLGLRFTREAVFHDFLGREPVIELLAVNSSAFEPEPIGDSLNFFYVFEIGDGMGRG